MDSVQPVPEVLRSEPDGDDLRPAGVARHSDTLKVEDLHELRFESLVQIGTIIGLYDSLDVPKEDSLTFAEHLTMKRDAWFVEAGSLGLIYLTHVVPKGDAQFHAVFWDGSLGMDRVAACKTVVTESFSRFALPRLSARVLQTNIPMKRFLRDIGFVLEGVTRRGWTDSLDTVHFGMLADERPWPVLPMGGE